MRVRIRNRKILATGAFVMFLLFLAGESYKICKTISSGIIAAAFVINHDYSREKSLEETM